MSAITTSNLTKKYGELTAVDNAGLQNKAPGIWLTG
jgi:hypothetical protein